MAMLLDWSAHLSLPNSIGALLDFGSFRPVTLDEHKQDLWYRASPAAMQAPDLRAIPLNENTLYTCRQETADLARIYSVHFWVGVANRAPGYVHISKSNRSLVAAMRWFAEEFPKGIQLVPHELRLATLPESDSSLTWLHDAPSVRIGRGEGKRQRFALWLNTDDTAAEDVGRFNACVQDPPRLYDREAFLKSQALDTAPPDRSDEMQHWEKAVSPVFARSGIDVPRLGHREYWDTVWMNNYRSRGHAGLLRYCETGDPRWFRYFDAVCHHVCDVDIIHYCPEHPEWVGSIHEYSADHTSGRPMGNIGLNSDDLLEHYLMTGDRDSLKAAQGLAEFILTCDAYSRSARAVGWPLAQVVRWYDQTGDERFLHKAQELVQAAIAFTEPRRGIFDEIHGNYSYHGSVPFMTAYLAYGLIRYHQLTGDDKAFDLLCKIADGVIAECQTTPGRFRYSPAPENNLIGLAASTCGWSVNLGGLFGYLHLLTGDAIYRQAMLDCFNAVMEHPEEISLDMVELQGWLLRGVVSPLA